MERVWGRIERERERSFFYIFNCRFFFLLFLVFFLNCCEVSFMTSITSLWNLFFFFEKKAKSMESSLGANEILRILQ